MSANCNVIYCDFYAHQWRFNDGTNGGLALQLTQSQAPPVSNPTYNSLEFSPVYVLLL